VTPAFDTIYFGGGTPSALEVERLQEILDALRHHLGVEEQARVFLEANPEDVSKDSLAAWRRMGIETLSLGTQSFQEQALRFLGRRHDPEEGKKAARAALEAGFSTVSVDLMFGLPGQTPEAWRQDLEAAVKLKPQHISCYQLTIHEGTPFGFRQGRGELAEMPGDDQGDLFLLTHSLLADHGFEAYEVSNFARGPEHQSRHNRKYWDHTPYLGLGPSAHSFSHNRRWWNHRKLGPWLAALESGQRPVAGEETLTGRDLALEALMLGLRTTAGVDLETLEKRYGVGLQAPNREQIANLREQGLATVQGSRLQLTLPGLAVADGLVASFEVESP